MPSALSPQERIALAWKKFQTKVQSIRAKTFQILQSSEDAEREAKIRDMKKRLS